MLHSEHIRSLPRDVKKSSILVALEAAGAPIQDVIQDAMKRDQALDLSLIHISRSTRKR